MPQHTKERPLHRIGFIHVVPFIHETAAKAFADTIELFSYGESLGFDSGWLRTRHVQYSLPSPTVLFAAIAQHTRRIDIGSAVITVENENPFRLAEDLAVADILSGGRLQPGFSVHPPRYDKAINDIVFDTGWPLQDYTYERIERIRSLLRGEEIRGETGPYIGLGGDIDAKTLQPFSPGLANRLWYGGGTLKSAEWAGKAGLGLLVSNISSAENGITEFAEAQRRQIEIFHTSQPEGQHASAAQAHVIVPTHGAGTDQLRRYEDYVESRTPRTRSVHGEKTIIAPDVFGSTDEIVETLTSDKAFQVADDFLVELPFELGLDDWKHILFEVATSIGPALGWTPAN